MMISQMPYPIASVYADLDDDRQSWRNRHEALYFTAYQLMRTVGLTLVGQYLTQEPPQSASPQTRRRLNRAIAGIRCPHFSDWITLLDTLHRHSQELQLNFFPEFAGAMNRVRQSRVSVPFEYALDYGARYQNLTWLEAFLALRNNSAHARIRDEVCQRDLHHFRPFLDDLLNAFGFLAGYKLLVLRSSLEEEQPQVQELRGVPPPAPAPTPLDDTLYHAFEFSPVVMQAPDGRLQGLFPLFHGHIEGEPLYCYDGHYLVERQRMRRRTIYYLGTWGRLPIDDEIASSRVSPPAPLDAGERLLQLLQARQIPWFVERKDVAPWTIRDQVNDYARRTLADLSGVKYLPTCYLDRPALSQPLEQFITHPDGSPQRAFLLSGRAGCGKTALLCHRVRGLLETQREYLVFFVRGDGLLQELEGTNLLLANILYKIGLNPRDFLSFSELFNHLAARMREDHVPDRRFVIVIDALNEAPQPTQIFREALEMVQSAREHPWVRIVLSAREEFLFVWRGRMGELQASPFYPLRSLFVLPAADPQRPRRSEELPAWDVPAFTEREAEEVYACYQRAKQAGEIAYACLTPWQRIPPATRREVLLVPLHLDLWMHAFDGREAPPISGVRDLFGHYLADIRHRFNRFWESMQFILDYMLEQGRTELDDDDAWKIEAHWRRGRVKEEVRLHFSPLEVACISGVMQKRTTEEGGGYRIPHQRLREQLFYSRLRDRDPALGPHSLRAWLALPPQEELVGALAQVAEDLWEADRCEELAVFTKADRAGIDAIRSRLLRGNAPIGVQALEHMLARRLEILESPVSLRHRLQALLNALPDAPESAEWMSAVLLFDVPDRLEGLPITQGLRALWETARPWLEERTHRHPEPIWQRYLAVSYSKLGDVYLDLGESGRALEFHRKALEIRERLYQAEPQRSDLARDLAVSYERLGDVYLDLGESGRALEFHRKALEIRERLYQAEPQRSDLARDLAVSYDRMARLSGGLDTEEGRRWFERAREILRKLRAEGRLPDRQAQRYLDWLEEALK